MNECEYIDGIDANFPYHDEHAWKAVIEEGVGISDNAAYMALYEICCGPAEIARPSLLKMVEYWSLKYSHPMKALVIEAAKAVIEGVELSEEKVLEGLDRIANYANLYNAANILLAASPRDGGRIRSKHEAIVDTWRRRTGS